jgi:hypothetical protein
MSIALSRIYVSEKHEAILRRATNQSSFPTNLAALIADRCTIPDNPGVVITRLSPVDKIGLTHDDIVYCMRLDVLPITAGEMEGVD